jgi:low affinity Fe/Cu permease
MKDAFRSFSITSANALGQPWMFIANVLLIIIWALAGPFFDYSDTWQLVINTATTVFTYLAVFLIQNTQNRDALAIHLKLDELIKGVRGARTQMVNLESLTDDELTELQMEFTRLGKKHSQDVKRLEQTHSEDVEQLEQTHSEDVEQLERKQDQTEQEKSGSAE